MGETQLFTSPFCFLQRSENYPECSLRTGGRGAGRGGSSASVGSPASFPPDGVTSRQSSQTCPRPCPHSHRGGAKGCREVRRAPSISDLPSLRSDEPAYQKPNSVGSLRGEAATALSPFRIKSHTAVRITRQGC